MVQLKINIDNHIWVINLSMTKELEFYYLTEVEKTTHPLWHDWDDDPDEGDPNKRVLYVYDDDVLPDGVSVFKVISKISKGVISVIERSQTDFFYFSASTERKGSFYENVISKLVNKLDGEWMYQVIDSRWFYISRIDE